MQPPWAPLGQSTKREVVASQELLLSGQVLVQRYCHALPPPTLKKPIMPTNRASSECHAINYITYAEPATEI